MAIADRLRSILAHLLLERPGRKVTLSDWGQKLTKSGAAIDQRAAKTKTPSAAETLRHIMSIERWGQRRLQVALGEPFVQDESDDYVPPIEPDLTKTRATFLATRQATIALVDKLVAAKVDPALTILHNQMGPLTVRGWLSYLNTHANVESLRIR